jgi:hypothetical protein
MRSSRFLRGEGVDELHPASNRDAMGSPSELHSIYYYAMPQAFSGIVLSRSMNARSPAGTWRWPG